MTIIHDEVDDRTLVIRHREGDDDAFREIVVRHHPSLVAHACRRLGGDPVAADDVVQETYLRAFRSIDRLDGDYHLAAWLHRILTNVCADAGRRRGRETRLFDKVSGEIEVEAPAADSELSGVPTESVERALEAMPETYREVLLLRFVEELSYSDVALKAGITEQNARARVSRGRVMLRRLLAGAAAVLGWMIPSMRRPQQALADPGAIEMATTVQQAQPVSQFITLAAQFTPAAAQAAPTFASTAPAIGKAAAAIGLAATVAIPTGAAVERKMNEPKPAATEVVTEEEVALAEEPLGEASATTITPTTVQAVTSSSTSSTSTPSSTTTTTEAETTTTTEGETTSTTTTEPEAATAPLVDFETTSPSTSTPAEPEAEPAPEPEPEPDVAEDRTGTMTGDGLTVTTAGPRTEVSGPFSLISGGQTFAGHIEGKLLIEEADPNAPDAAREVRGDLLLTLGDGTTHQLRVVGTVIVDVDEEAGNERYDLTTTYRLQDAEALGLAPEGELTGELHTGGSDGSLTFELSGAPAES